MEKKKKKQKEEEEEEKEAEEERSVNALAHLDQEALPVRLRVHDHLQGYLAHENLHPP